ncbi:GFA family protein [Amphibacillus sp. Q70]|uniref:GFA family protein n=1 Tax=Amphibacillus sp. Q70 TaxID=3453416 RepID=UPI003F85427D
MVIQETNTLKQAKGNCLCGQVEFVVDELSQRVHTCHCDTCRTISGGPSFRNHSLNMDTVTCSDWGKITIFESSDTGERGFCSYCGTQLFYRSKTRPTISLNIELFRDILTNVNFEAELFCLSKLSHYSFANDTEKLANE